jgi:hypothetical protein
MIGSKQRKLSLTEREAGQDADETQIEGGYYGKKA